MTLFLKLPQSSLHVRSTIFTSVIKFQYSSQDKKKKSCQRKPSAPFPEKPAKGREPGSDCHRSGRESSPLTCDLCLGILIKKKNAKSGCSSHLERKWLYLGIGQYFQSQQAGLSQQTAPLLSNPNDLSGPARLCSWESKESSSPATLQQTEQTGPSIHFSTRDSSGLQSY